MSDNRFDVTKEEAFTLGRIEGQKEAFKEMVEVSENDAKFIRAYIKARIKTLERDISNIGKFNKGI